MKIRRILSARLRARAIAVACVAALATAMLVVIAPAPPASAASYTFLVDSLSPIGNDINPGDGVCRTSTNTCTLRAALQESNALGALGLNHQVTISPAADVDSSTPGVQSTGVIVGDGPVNTTNFMFVGTLTNQGDAGAYFMATAPVTLDFQNRLGISSASDLSGATAVYINGPDVSLRNFNNIKSNETAFVVGGAGDRAVIENGTISDPGAIVAERAIWIADGADDLTVRRVVFNSLWSGGPAAIMVAPSAQVNNLLLDQIRMTNTGNEAYSGLASAGGATTRPTLTNMTIRGSLFTQFSGASRVLMFDNMILSGANISGNTFRDNNIPGYPLIKVDAEGTGQPNVISNNSFDESGPGAVTYAINMVASLAATVPSGWRIEDNYFDGMADNAVRLQGFGITTVQRNRFGVNSATAGTNNEVGTPGVAVDEETRHWSFFYNSWTSPFSNDRARTWYPTQLATDPLACTATVTVTPPTVVKPTAIAYDSTVPVPPVTIDVYYTSIANGINAYAEVYLGRQTGITSAGATVTVPYTLGAGFLRLQTIDSAGRASQYSRVITQPAPDTCGPRVTVEQAAAQQDPVVQRDLLFTVRTTEALAAAGAGALTTTDFSLAGSSAPNPRVTNVVKVDNTTYEVTARADGAGTVQVSLPGGAITDALGNPGLASTSVDNVVTYVSPLTIDPTSVTVTEGGAAATYSVTNSLAATAPISIQATSANPAWATVSSSPLTIGTSANSGQFSVAAVDDTIINGTRSTTVSQVSTSADPEFDGLILSPVSVTVNDNDTPSPTLSTLATTTGSVVADGVATHTATVTARNADGTPVQGASIQFNGAAELQLSNSTCTTAANGTCSITAASTELGTFDLTARIGGTQISGSPSPLEFAAGPPDAGESTISASPTTIVGDGTSTSVITVTAHDALGNRVSVGGATVTMATTLGTLGPVTDHQDGTYSATLTAPTALGTATVSFTMNAVASPNTVTVTVIAGPASPARSTIEADPTTITANGTSTSTVTVRLLDGLDNPTSGGPVTMTTDLGTLSAVTDNGDGTFTATLTSAATAGLATISFAVDGAAATAQAEVELVPGASDPATSTISADPDTLTADGSSTSLVTVQLVDAFGNPLTAGGPVVTMASTNGTLGAVSDNDDGTYTATLTAPSTPGSATVTFAIGGVAGTAQATVTFTAGAASASTSQIAITPTTMPADGSSTGAVTVTLRDSFGNPVGAGGATVTMSAGVGTVGAVTDNGDGTYSATYTAGTTAGLDAVSFTVGGVSATAKANLTLTAGDASAGTSTISAFPNSIEADGTSESLLTVTLLDAFGNELVAGGDTVVIQTTNGSVGTVTDNGDGTYTADLTSSTSIGSALVSFTVNGSAATDTQTVLFRAGAASVTNSTIEATPTAITADGTSTSAVTVQLRDGNDNELTASGGTVVIRTSLGTVSSAVDNGDGTYSATLTAGTVSGPATLDFTIDGAEAEATAIVDLQPGALDLARSTIGAAATSLPAGGFSTTTVTVQLTDAFGNLLGVGGRTVVLAATAGTLDTVSDNGDGTYSADLTSAELATSSQISYTVDGQPGTATLTIVFTAGDASPSTSTIVAAPTSIAADGAATSTVTVTTNDAYGNLVTSGATVVISTDLGTVSGVTDNGDGTHTATLTAPTGIGTALVSYTVNTLAGGSNATVEFVAGAADATTSLIAATPTSITADGFSTSAITVSLRDAFDNPVRVGGATVAITATDGTFTPTTDNGNGTYTATLTSTTTAATATVSFAVGGTAGTATASVEFVAGSADASTSQIAASPTSITADGVSTSTVTVTLLDAFGNLVSTAGDVVAVSTDVGSLGAVTDNGDGTYTATLTSATTAGTATVSFTVGGTAGTATASVVFEAGAADAATSEIAASPTSITADGVSTSTVTVTLLDAFGNLVSTAGDVVAVSTDVGSLGAVTDNSDGTYTATLTSATTAGTATVSFTVDGTAGTATADVVFVAGAADATTSLIAASPVSITADGVSTSTVTVTLLDAQGNQLATGGATVGITSSVGSVGAVTDNGDGTYTATLTSATTAGTATVSFTVGGTAGTATASVVFVAGAADAATSEIAASPTSITADGVSTSTVTVTLLDVNGNLVTTAGDVVAMSTSSGSVGAVTDNGDGTYTATLTSATTAGTATVSFTVDGTAGTATADVVFVAGAADATTSLIAASPTSITADGVSTSTVTVTLLDAQGNQLATGGATVGITSSIGSLGAVTDNGDGTYTATLTSATTAGTATVSFTVGGTAGTATASVVFVAGAADATTSEIAASPTSITADGVSTSTVTVTLLDVNGNPLETGGATVAISSSVGSVGAVTDNGDGTYTATLTSASTTGTATVSFTVGGTAGTATTTVDFVAGAPSTTTSLIVATPLEITADGTSTSDIKVTLLDAFGNPVTVGGNTVEVFTSAGSVGTVTSIGGGVYVAELTSTTVAGTVATLTFAVNSTLATPTASVKFVAGAASTADSTISASPTSIAADGVSTSVVTVTLLDIYGNPLNAGGATVGITSDIGSVGSVTDNGDGTYSATLTSATTAGTATVSFTVGAAAGEATASVAFVAGAADATTSEIAASPTSITADGVSTSTVTVTLLDAQGNVVATAGDVVAVSTDVGSLGAVTDNGDGTYTAALTSATTAGTATVLFTVSGTAGTATASVVFVAGAADATTSEIAASPTSITADGVSTSTVTVTLLDAQGNVVTTAGDVVAVSTDVGSLGAVTDNGDGTYTATLTSATTAGTATVSFTVSGTAGTATASVVFVAGAADAATSEIAASPTSITADGVSTSTVTVTLLDAQGNLVTTAGAVVAMSADVGSLGAVTDNGDGTYTATLTSATLVGTAVVSFTVGGTAGTATASVVFVAGAADATRSQISASPISITADGVSTSTVTVTLLDAQGNVVSTAGAVVGISTSAGSLGAVTDNGDGTYTATLTSATTAGTATVSFTVSGTAGTATADVVFVAGAADATTSLIAASPTSITADGVSTSTVTVTLLDAQGNQLATGGATVGITSSVGSLGAVTDNGDGTYTATLTSATTAGTATVSFTVGGTAGTATASVVFVAGAADAATSEIAASPTSITADGVSTSTVTVTLLDVNGNLVTGAGDVVGMSTSAGSLGAVTDNGDGTYTATLTSATTAGTATVSFTVSGTAGTATASVVFVAGAADATTSEIAASPTSITADGTSTSTVTVTLLDVNGNLVTGAGDVVGMSTSAGSLGAVTDNSDGTYTATLTSATTAGTATVSFTVDGTAGTATADVVFVAGAADATTSLIAASPTSITADGVSTSTVTVTLLDAQGNQLATGGATVGITSSIGSLGAVTDNGDGTYTATLTSATTAGTATVSFTVSGTAGTATASVVFVAGAADAATSEIAASPTSITADGTSTSTVTVTLLDVNGNLVTGAGDVVGMSTSAGSLGAVTDNSDGTYTATLTSATTAGTATVSFTVDGTAGTATADVVFVAGAADAATSEIAASPTSITADGVSTSTVTVTLLDAQGNQLATGGATVGITSSIGSLGAVTDNGDGTYTATLTSATTAGTATVSFTVGGTAGTATASVVFVAGAADATTSEIAASPTSITADGTSTSTVTVTLRDAQGNLVTTAGAVVGMSTSAGSLGAVTDNGDGTYTATLTSATTAGTATVSFTVASTAATATASVAFVAGAVDATTSLIAASPTSITADGVSTSLVTVTLRDANGNPLTGGGQTVTMATTAGTLDAVSDNSNGTYTAQLTSATAAGDATLSFTVNAVAGGQTATVRFAPGQWNPSTSSISAAGTELVADGVATLAVTVTLEDAQGNQLNVGGSTVLIATTRGTISAVTDNGDGTYTATLTSATVAGAATLSFTVDGQAGTDTAVVLMVPGTASATLSTIDATPTTVAADGTATSTVTVQLVDALGNALTGSGGTVIINTSAGVLTPAVDNGNGTYTATLTASTTLATATLTFTVSGTAATDTATVSFVPGPLSVADSTIQSSVTEIQVDTSSTATITVTARDAQGNPRGASAGTVTMATTAGTLGAVTDNGDGTYTATLAAPSLVDVAVVTFTMNGIAGTSTATITFVAGVASPSSSTIAAAPVQIVADGSSTSTVTVTLLDGPGNALTLGGDLITMSTTQGTLGGVTDNGNGTYTATLTSATTVGTATVSFTVNGAAASRTTSVEFLPGSASAAQAQIVASPGSLVVNSGQTSAVTVILRDAYGNRILTGGADVVVSTSQSVLTSVSDNGDGTYTATLLADSVPGTAVLNFTVNSAPGSSTASVEMVIGPASPANATISATPAVIESGGSSTSMVTVQLFDAFGNALTSGGPVVGMSTTAGTLGAVTDNGDGTYTAVLTSAASPAVATVSFTIDAVAGAASTQVRFQDTTPPPPPSVSGPVAGTSVNVVATFGGTGEPGARVTVTDSNGRELCSATVDDSGQWSCTPAFRLPPGPLTFSVTQTDASGNISSQGPPVTIEVVGPTLNIDVAQLERGQSQVVTGTGFIPGEVVSGLVQSTPLDIGTAIADAQGTVTFTFVVPADFEIGMHTVTLTGELSGPVVGEFEVVATPPGPGPTPTPGPVPPIIPVTGADAWIPAGLSGVALLLGALLLGWRRRQLRGEMLRRQGS